MSTNAKLRQKVGVWRAVVGLGDYKLKHLLWPEGLFAVLLGGGGGALIVRATEVRERVGVMGELLMLAGAFLAVVFTALAIVVSLPSSRYLRMLEETPGGGMRRFLDPFLVAVGTQIAVVLAAVAYGLVAEDVAWWIEHVAFYGVGLLFVYGLLDIAGLARSLVRHGIYRAVDAAAADREEPNRVHRLDQRRGDG